MQRLDTFQLLRELSWERQSLHPVEAPKEIDAAKSKHVRLLWNRHPATDMDEPVVMTSKIGWSCSGHSALSSALEIPVTTPLLVKQGGRLVQTLFEILFAVVQRFHAPLQQENILLHAHRGCIWR